MTKKPLTKKERIIKLLDGVYKMHKHYDLVKTNESRIEIAERTEPLLERLDKLNISRRFTETFLVYGDEFLVSEFGVSWDKMKKA